MQQIADGVWVHNLGIANIGVLELPNGGLALVDTGGPGSGAKIEKALAENNWTPEDIKHILITHGHYDHIGDLEALVQNSGATVWAHRLEAPVIRGTQKVVLPPDTSLNVFWRFVKGSAQGQTQQAGVVHRELQGASNLEVVRPKLRAVFLPGHTPGQLGYYLEDSRTLFGGDCCMNILGLRVPLAAFTTDMREAKRSVAVAAKLEPNNLVVGHGEPIVDVAAGALERLAKRLKT
jgi:glyoxylase-like metal-dependent hydrolase (beta-lactamase superfamily II)